MNWRDEIDALRSCMYDYDASHEHLDDDEDGDEDRPRDQPLEAKVNILHDLCNLLRRAREQNIPEYDVLFDEANTFINQAVAKEVKADWGPCYVWSFAHTPDTLLKDPMQKMLYLENKRDVFKSLIGSLGLDPGRVDEFITSRGPALQTWDEDQQPHPKSTVLSRFRDGIDFPSAATYPRANYIWQARCEVINEGVTSAHKLVLSADGSFLAMSGATGWKNRDPVVNFWLSGSEDLDQKNLHPPLAHLIQDIVLDDARQLLFVADYDRVKSYSFAPGTRKRAVHTLKARTHNGPLAVLPSGRILRAGKGSALVWNIDDLETHYPGDGKTFTKVGEGSYKGFEDCVRDEDCKKETSAESAPRAALTFADGAYTPGTWHLHAPSGHMLCAEDTQKVDRFECVALDLEHGGKFSTSAEEPNMFLTACGDGHARLYDVREPLPVLTIDGEYHEGPMDSALFVHIDGLPVVLTGGTNSQGIRFWDIRAKKLVYELSTGNNIVRSLAWSATDSTLYASTVCEYVDRMGGRHGYRKARIPKRKSKKTRSESESAEAEDEDEEMGNEEEWEDEDEDEDDGNSDPELMDYYDTVRWPKKAYHLEDYFGEVFDCGTDALFRYSFKEDPDTDVCPPEGSSSFGMRR